MYTITIKVLTDDEVYRIHLTSLEKLDKKL